jgi:ankyrin repeat protein
MQYRNWLFGKDGALLSASAHGDLPLVEELFTRGANINVVSGHGFTPLHRAAENGHKDIVEFLLAQKADPSISSAMDETPLSLADKNGHDEISKLLRQSNHEEA